MPPSGSMPSFPRRSTMFRACVGPPVEEVISDGYNGFLVDFFNPQEIAERIHRVLEKNPQTLAIRKNARDTVIGRFDLHRKCIPRHLELLGFQP
jgi:glycosyltransferase involved in cell wall biosynthesis